mmetsp:Transcript_65865/g.140937  ORF Transcript_65865/g.140937 Transcript_65865/m.140937 type:complete len:254 (-) Transcript_65865:616-1377(-)
MAAHNQELIGALHGLALVRVHGRRLCVGDAEELGVKHLDAVNIALVAGVGQAVHLSRLHVMSEAVSVDVPATNRSLDEGVAASLVGQEPEAYVVLRITANNGADAIHSHRFAFWTICALLNSPEDLHVSSDGFQAELRSLAEEPRLQSRRPSLASVAVLVELVQEQHHHSRLGLNRNLLNTRAALLGDERQGACKRPQELHHANPLPLHEGEEVLTLRVGRLAHGYIIGRFVVIHESLTDHEVGAARNAHAEA